MNFLISSLSLVGLTLFALPLQAQKVWLGADGLGGDGDWFESAHWQGGVPSSTTTSQGWTRFFMSGTLTNPTAVIDIKESEAALARELYVGLGKSVTYRFAAGSSLQTGTLSYFGLANSSITDATGAGASSTHFVGPSTGSAALELSTFYTGVDFDTGGHSVTFSGNLVVTDPSTSFSSVGTRATDNTMTVSSGAQLTRYGLRIGSGGSSMIRNHATVTGPGSRVVVNGGGAANKGLLIGAVAGSDYNASAHGNFAAVRDGAVLQVTTGAGGSSMNSVLLGSAAKARSNYIDIADSGSVMELAGNSALLIGDAAANNLGGNYVRIGNGGAVKSSGAITIHDYDRNGGLNDGQNRLSIESGGTLTSSGTLASSGLLQLAEGGTLAGATLTGSTAALEVTIADQGRFELAGSGLGSTVETTVNAGGTLAVGLKGDTTASTLELNSLINFESGSVLELSLFDSSSSDTIHFGDDAALLLTGDVTLALTLENGFIPAAGSSWSLFTGQTDDITGIFNLSHLDPLVWDISRFNQIGGWQVSVIPEPSTYALVAIGLGCSAFFARRRKQRCQA